MNEATRGCKVQSANSTDITLSGPRVANADFIDTKFESADRIKIPVTETYNISFDPKDDKLVYEPQENFE